MVDESREPLVGLDEVATARRVLAALRKVPHAMSVFDENDRILFCSDEFRRVYSPVLTPEFDPLVHQMTYSELITAFYTVKLPAERRAARIAADIESHRKTNGFQRDVLSANGWRRRFKYALDSGEVVGLSFGIDEMVRRTAELDRAKREMEHAAFHDPLTDLPNRRGLTQHLNSVLTDLGEAQEPLALLHVDLDKFKLVNDTLGHEAGDKVLKTAARVLRDCTRGDDYVARIGGDEFVVVCRGFSVADDLATVARRIVTHMAEPISYADESVQIGASIGIAVCQAGQTAANLMLDADMALYDAKERGRGTFAFFSTVFRERYSSHQAQIHAVSEAMRLNAFEPYFQPIIDASTGAVTGLETLPFWVHIERGLIGEEAFRSAIQNAHLEEELDAMIFRKALRAIRFWQEEGADAGRIPMVWVNLSSATLAQENVAQRLSLAAAAVGIVPSQIGFEVEEGDLQGDQQNLLLRNVIALSEAGFALALDDFGAGQSSVARMLQLPVDRVKIGEAVVTGVHDDADIATIVTALVSMVRALGMKSVALGAHSEAERAKLVELGCDLLQGRAVARPIDARTVPIWLELDGGEGARDTCAALSA